MTADQGHDESDLRAEHAEHAEHGGDPDAHAPAANQIEPTVTNVAGSLGHDGAEDHFADDTVRAITTVRDAYARVIESMCPGSKAVSTVCEAFGIHRKLAWQVTKVAYAQDPYVATRHIPSGKSLRLWLGSAERVGVDRGLIDRARQASDGLERVIKMHASTRSEFEMLIEGVDQTGDQQKEEKWRQQSFMGNSFTLGIHCRVLMSMCVLFPSRTRPGYFSMAQVRGVMGYRQTRPGVRWVVNQSVVIDDDNNDSFSMTRQPLDPAAAQRHGGVPILPEYCSDPMPRLQRVPAGERMMQDEILSGPVGLLGERTLVTGEVLGNVAPVHATSENKRAHFGVGVRIPCERVHFDLFVHAGLFGDVVRELEVFNEMSSQITFDPRDEIRVSDSIKAMGRGVSLAQAPAIAGYPDLARSVMDRLDLRPDDFELYRINMAYPPIPASVMMRHELLPRDEERE